MMKNLIQTSMLLGALNIVAACGQSKDPIKDYRHLQLSNYPTVLKSPKEYVYVDREIPVEVPVEVPVYISKEAEQNYIQGQVFQIIHPVEMNFVEGQKNSFEFSVKILQGKVQFDIEPTDLPKGAEIELVKNEVNLATYKIHWTPEFGTIEKDKREIKDSFKISLTKLNLISEDAKEKEKLQKVFSAISKTRELPIVVRRTEEIPTLKVIGLGSAVNAGTIQNFSLEVTAPGTHENDPPKLNITYNETNALTARGLEANGAFYVLGNNNNNPPEKLGNGKWKYNLKFDTLNLPLQTPLDKSMKPIVTPKELLVRISFQALTSFGTTSKEQIISFPIQLTQTPSTQKELDARARTGATP